MEENTKDFQTNSQYLECQSKLNLIYEKRLMVSKYEVNVTGMKAARNLQNFS